MLLELNILFPDPQHIIVSLNTDNGREETDLLDFSSPFSEKDFKKIRWYLENYATEYSTDIDIQSANSIAKKLPLVGNVLFNKVFATRQALRLFKKFRDQHELGRLVTITADDPAIFSLPWELLHPANKGGQFLINEMPRISIRRRTHGKKAFEIKPKTQAHILFVVSRPQNVGMVNPPASAQAVLNALGKNKRVTVEFLRPATLKKLRERLKNQELPHVDIVHFYGPSRQDASLIEQAKADLKSLPATLTTEASNIELTKDTTYLLFEKDNGDPFIVPTPLFANLLNRYQVPLVILSACRWARVGHKEDVDSVAAELSAKGIPFVLAIRYWMLKPATQILFKTFYQGLAQGKKIGAALHTARLALYETNERREILSKQGLFQIKLYDWFSPVLYQLGQDTALLTKVKSEDLSDSIEANNFSSNNLPRKPRAGFFGRGPELWQIERCFMRGRRRFLLSSVAAGQGKTCLAQEAGRWLQRTGLFKRVVFIDYANSQGLNPVSVAVSTIANVLHKNLLDADAVTQALRRVPTLLIFDNVDAIATATTATTATTAAESLPTFTDQVDEKTTEPTLILDKEDSVFNDDGLPKLILEPETETKTPESNPELILSDKAKQKTDDKYEDEDEDNTFSFERSEPLAEKQQEQLENEQIQENGFRQLLEAAKKWSQAGQSGIIFITRNPHFNLLNFSDKGSTEKLSLDNLDKNTALQYFEALMILPPNSRFGMPKRAEVETLFEKVGYHPLSINILAFAIKNEPIETVTKRLDNLLTNQNSADNPEHSLQASLKLFVEQLEPTLRQHLPKLGVFKGGAFENVLQAITEIPHEIWQKLREALESVGLIQAENFDGVKVPYLIFNPTLAPTLWSGLSSKEQEQLKERYSHGYHEFSEFLYNLENPYQAHFIEQRELPNLLQAAYESLDTGKAWALSFADKVKSFLADFGFKSDDKKFIELNDDSNKNCDCDWLVKKSEEADEYYSRCQYLEAQEAYEDILEALKDQEPNYDSSVALGWIGRCMAEHGELDEAVERFRKTLSELAELETSPLVERQKATIQSYLAAVLKEKGDTSAAITAYEKALSMMKAIKDQHQEAVMETEIAQLLISQGDLVKAERFLHHALSLFKSLNQPEFEAETLSHLGKLYTKAKQWKAAIQAHTKAANLFEVENVYSSAAENWEKLAEINESLGNQQDADIAYMKAIKSYKATIEKNPDDATILLDTYEHLAEIAEEKQKDTVQAQKYRRLAQQLPQSTTTTTCPNLDKHKQFIDAVVATVGHPGLRAQLDTMLEQRESKGWHSLIAAIRRLLNGERDGDNLSKSEDLDSEDSGIVHEILSRIENVKEKEMSLL